MALEDDRGVTIEGYEVIVIQSTSLAAVHVHAPVTITRTFPLPPLEPKACDGGTKDQVHDDVWLIVTT